MVFHRLNHRLIAAIAGLMFIFISSLGLTLFWSIRQSLQTALGEKVQTIALALASQYTSEEITLLTQGPGPRIRPRFLEPLRLIERQADIRRIYFFSMDYRSLLDTDTTVIQGEIYYQLMFFRQEMQILSLGKPAHTGLFKGIDNKPVMCGFAPLVLAGSTVGGIGVDGNARFLSTVQDFGRRILIFGGMGMGLALLTAVLLARSVTRPVAELASASQQIGAGDYVHSIPSAGSGEIGELARTMELMRQNVIKREQELKAMVAAVAHEIRNPLGGIELFASLLSDEIRANGPATAHLEHIKSDIRYLNEIVNRFLEYARPDNPHPQICRLSEIRTGVIRTLTPELESRRIRLVWDADAAGIRIQADAGHIKRIMINLLQNSMHAIGQGGEIQITQNQANHHCLLRIQDTGLGIPAESLPKIFEPFYTTREKGTGLGLAIVKRLVEANGGQICLISSDSNGTIFEFTIPLKE
jgi:signal transduction histidine kinase